MWCEYAQTGYVWFYILLTVHLGTIFVNNQLDTLFNVFISLLYMFWATQYSSSVESIVSIHHLVYITPCRWPAGMQVCSKHVEKWNKHIKKCVKLVINTNGMYASDSWNYLAARRRIIDSLMHHLLSQIPAFMELRGSIPWKWICHIPDESQLFLSSMILSPELCFWIV